MKDLTKKYIFDNHKGWLFTVITDNKGMIKDGTLKSELLYIEEENLDNDFYISDFIFIHKEEINDDGLKYIYYFIKYKNYQDFIEENGYIFEIENFENLGLYNPTLNGLIVIDWIDVPNEIKELSFNGGDEDYVYLMSKEYRDKKTFIRCIDGINNLSIDKYIINDKFVLYIESH